MSLVGRAAPWLIASGFSLVISSNIGSSDLRSLAVAAGWNQSDTVTVTINSGVSVGSATGTSTGLTVSGSFPGGVFLINNGTIYGGPGLGGQDTGFGNSPAPSGTNGGVALAVSTAITITNNGSILGGGGGGGSGGYGKQLDTSQSKGGAGGNGAYGAVAAVAGGAGWSTNGGQGGSGGNGGTLGSNGAGGNPGYDAIIPTSTTPGGGGLGGNSVTGNANITWLATGTRTGAIS